MSYIENLYGLEGKVAVITGGGVLGSAMANALANSGVKVAILDLNKEKAETVANQIKNEGCEALGLGANVLEESQLEAAKEAIITKWNKVDILINGAGGNMPGATIGPDQTVFELSIPDLRKVMDLNLLGSIIPTQVFGKVMANQKKGVVINISSMTATQAVTRVMGYSLAKSAIDNYTRWMATEMAQKFGEGIRVNAIAPGFFIGEQNKRLLTNEDGSLTERGETIIKNTPMGRFGKTEELDGTLLWLCSEGANFVTGIVVPVDGGFSCFSGV